MQADSLPSEPLGKSLVQRCKCILCHWCNGVNTAHTKIIMVSLLRRIFHSVLGNTTELNSSNYRKGFPCGSAGKESACNVGDLGLIPGLGRAPGEGNSYPLQYSALKNSMDCIVHEVAQSGTRLGDFHFSLHFHCFLGPLANA